MKRGYLSEYFDGVAVKVLSAVEADVLASHQHEFNGVEGLRELLGETESKVRYDATFLYMTDNDEEPIVETDFLTWYDARQKARLEKGVIRREYRLYFPTNTVTECATAGDILVIAKKNDGTLLAIVAEAETTICRQIIWLFGVLDLSHPGFSVREELETEQDRIEFASRFILESIGVVVESSEDTWLDDMLLRFGKAFPKSRIFSEYARATLPDVRLADGIDETLSAWIEREEILFRTLEKHIIAERLAAGFEDDVDGFLSFSLSVQNRRKSRAGLSLENHLEYVFVECGIRYTRAPPTERKSKPDFLFPGITEYNSSDFNSALLTMLGVKSTCKERWRQVLSEADRIARKHLLTLEAAISEAQTEEMRSHGLQLVLPRSLHESYTGSQQKWLMDVRSFVDLTIHRQSQKKS